METKAAAVVLSLNITSERKDTRNFESDDRAIRNETARAIGEHSGERVVVSRDMW